MSKSTIVKTLKLKLPMPSVIRVAQRTFPTLGKGIGRVCVGVSPRRVLKLAMNQFGAVQNLAEGSNLFEGLAAFNRPLFVSSDGYVAVAKKGVPVSQVTFTRQIGVTHDYLWECLFPCNRRASKEAFCDRLQALIGSNKLTAYGKQWVSDIKEAASRVDTSYILADWVQFRHLLRVESQIKIVDFGGQRSSPDKPFNLRRLKHTVRV